MVRRISVSMIVSLFAMRMKRMLRIMKTPYQDQEMPDMENLHQRPENEFLGDYAKCEGKLILRNGLPKNPK